MSETVTLATLAGGAAEEMFSAALPKLLENIADLNTDYKAKRTMLLSLAFTTDEERHIGDVLVTCSVKLATVKGHRAGVYYGTRHGIAALVEAPKQEDLFSTPAPRPLAVVPGDGGAH